MTCIQVPLQRTRQAPSYCEIAAHPGVTVRAAYQHVQALASRLGRHMALKTCHPLEMGDDEIMQFLSALAVHEHVSASTQNQALCALLFLHREVLGHRDVSTTMIYTHVLNRGGRGVPVQPIACEGDGLLSGGMRSRG